MWGARRRTVFEICFVMRLVETFCLHDSDEWTPGGTLDLSRYDSTTSANVIFNQLHPFEGRPTFLVSDSTLHDAKATVESVGGGDSTLEGLGTSSAGLSVYGDDSLWTDTSTPATTLTYTDYHESTYVTFDEVTEPKDEYFTTINYSTTNSTGEPHDSTSLVTQEKSTFETVVSVSVTTGCYGNTSTGEDEVPTNRTGPLPPGDGHSVTTVTASTVGVCVVCLVVLILWKLRRSRQSESLAALGDMEVFYTKPRRPLILKEEVLLYALSVHLTKGTGAKILSDDRPANLLRGQREFVEVTGP